MLKRIILFSSLFTFVALVPLATFGLSIIQMVSNHLVQRTLRELEQSVLIDADRTKRFFDATQGDLSILSQVAAMQELIRARIRRDSIEIERWQKALEQVFLAFSRNRKVYSQIRYLDEEGQELVRVDADGVNPPRIVPGNQLKSQRLQDDFSETMKLGPGHVFIFPPDLHRKDSRIDVPHHLVTSYATPLFDDAGRRRGIVSINLMVGKLLDALYQEAKAVRKVVHVVDQEGYYLLHSDPAKQWGSPHDLNTGARLQQDLPDLATRLLSRQAVATVMGEQVVAAQPLALSPSRPDPFLVIIELMPTRVALAPIADFRQYLLILLVGMGAVTVVGAVLVGNRLTRPVVTLAEAVQQVQQGNLEVRVKAGGPHEITVLVDAFNAMAASLVQSRSRIERQLAKLETLNRIGTAVSGTLSLTEVLDQASNATLLALEVQTAEIFLVDEEQAEVVLAQHRGLAAEAFQEIVRFKFGCGFPGRVALSGEPLITTDLAQDARFLRKRVIELGFRTYAAIPLKAEGKVVGALGVATTTLPSTEIDLSLLTAIGTVIGMAIANAHLYGGLSRATERLETKVEELERMQSRLIEAERLQATGQMAAGVAHDFNNALMGILGQTQLMWSFLEQGPVVATAEGYAGLVKCLARQEQAILDAATTVRKIRESTRQKDKEAFGPVALNGLIDQVLAMSRPRWKDQAEAAGVRITVQTALADTPPVLGNAAELYEALTNLLFNALDAMPHGGTMTITTRHVFGSEMEEARAPEPGARIPEPGTGSVGEWVELAVTDTGIGMSQAVQARLFEPFFTTKGVRGNGLGLSMVHGIISRHEGKISVESAEGQGTTITLHLPVAKAIAETMPPPAAPPSITRPLKLLVIDDDPLLAATLSDLLRILGHEAAIATSGEEGIARLTAETFDLVMTDLGMSGMSGWDVAAAVKARRPELPVILVTGWGDALEGESLESRGANAILAKPYTTAQLQDVLAQCVIDRG